MVDEKNEIDELTKEIRKIIADNSTFISRVFDDDFEDEDEDERESPDSSEELI